MKTDLIKNTTTEDPKAAEKKVFSLQQQNLCTEFLTFLFRNQPH